jgi:hypothetical protein
VRVLSARRVWSLSSTPDGERRFSRDSGSSSSTTIGCDTRSPSAPAPPQPTRRRARGGRGWWRARVQGDTIRMLRLGHAGGTTVGRSGPLGHKSPGHRGCRGRRALRSHRRSRGFESHHLHQMRLIRTVGQGERLARSFGSFQRAESLGGGLSVQGADWPRTGHLRQRPLHDRSALGVDLDDRASRPLIMVRTLR